MTTVTATRSHKVARLAAFMLACGCAVSAFRKVYSSVRSFNVTGGDTINLSYTLNIK